MYYEKSQQEAEIEKELYTPEGNGTIIDDKAYSVQYIADAPKYSDYLPILQKMIDSLVIKNSKQTGIGTMSNNSTKIHPNNTQKCCFSLISKFTDFIGWDVLYNM